MQDTSQSLSLDALQPVVIAATSAETSELEVTQLQHRSREITRLTAMGFKPGQIAAQLGVTAICVRKHLDQPIVQQQIQAIQNGRDASTMEIVEQIKALGPKAVGVLEQIMTKEEAKDADRLRAVETVLGYAVPKQVQSEQLSREDIEELKARARASGMIVDVEALEA